MNCRNGWTGWRNVQCTITITNARSSKFFLSIVKMREWQKKLFFQFPFRYRRCFLLHLKIGSIVRYYIERVFISTATAHSIQNYSLIFEMEARAVKCHRNPFQKLTKHTMKLRIVLYRHRCCRRRENVRIIARESEPTYSGNRFSMTFFSLDSFNRFSLRHDAGSELRFGVCFEHHADSRWRKLATLNLIFLSLVGLLAGIPSIRHSNCITRQRHAFGKKKKTSKRWWWVIWRGGFWQRLMLNTMRHLIHFAVMIICSSGDETSSHDSCAHSIFDRL